MRGPETEKSHLFRRESGFYNKYMQGFGLDVGFGDGYDTVLQTSKGIESRDWVKGELPFDCNSLDYVFSSHCLEHIQDHIAALREFHRVLKVGGFCITTVPHQFLYEKKKELPSRYNADHKRFYTPARLLTEIESALVPNTYRIRELYDNDKDFDYSIPPQIHSFGCYEIVCVFEKLQKPQWDL